MTSAVFGSQGHQPHGRQIRLDDEIAIALLPARRLVAGHRLHIDVVGEQIVAAMRLLIGAVGEILRMEALADEPPLHVGESRDDRIDRARRDFLLEFGQASAFHVAM